jgi:hypothetical protein
MSQYNRRTWAWEPWQHQRRFGWQWDQWFWWNGWGWNKRSLIGFVPFINRAWRPDIAPSTVRHFQYHLLRWGTTRGVRPNQVRINMNSGSVVQDDG